MSPLSEIPASAVDGLRRGERSPKFEMRSLPAGVRYDGTMEAPGCTLYQFTEIDRSSPSFGASFYLDLESLAIAALVKRRAEKRAEFARGLISEIRSPKSEIA
jgi:hypothetical protein